MGLTDEPEEERCAAETAIEAAEHAPATLLEVVVRSHHGTTYSHPGRTDIAVKTTPFAHVTLTADHGVGTQRYQSGVQEVDPVPDIVPPDQEEQEEDARARTGEFVVRWSCHHPRETIHYTVTSQGGAGAPLTSNGTFTVTLSAKWCATAKQREHHEREATERAEARVRAEEREEAAEQAHREQEAERHELEQWESNCRQLGGIVVRLHIGSHGATVPVCRGPNGGTINVPV